MLHFDVVRMCNQSNSIVARQSFTDSEQNEELHRIKNEDRSANHDIILQLNVCNTYSHSLSIVILSLSLSIFLKNKHRWVRKRIRLSFFFIQNRRHPIDEATIASTVVVRGPALLFIDGGGRVPDPLRRQI